MTAPPRGAGTAAPGASPSRAEMHGVPTKRLNEQVKRNATRFPPAFMFRLTDEEVEEWRRSRSQFATLKRGHNIKYLPFAFTEHGALMAANLGEAGRRLAERVRGTAARIVNAALSGSWPEAVRAATASS